MNISTFSSKMQTALIIPAALLLFVFSQTIQAGIPLSDLYVGSNSTVAPTNFTSGTNSFANTYVGYDATASNNQLTVSGSALLSNTNQLIIGSGGSSNVMIVSNGGTVTDLSATIGNYDSASYNSVIVGGAGSSALWSNSGTVNVGFAGNSNDLQILSNGVVKSTDTWIGGFSTATNNSVLLNGGILTNANSLIVGYGGGSNSLVISNGTAGNAAGYVGFGAGADGNSVLVTGSNSLWKNTGALSMGTDGSGNALVVSNGGKVTVSGGDALLGYSTNSSDNSLTVTGVGSVFSNNATLLVGNAGSGNTLQVLDGGLLSTFNSRLGGTNTASVSNAIVISGSGSRWTNSGTIRVGSAGSYNNLLITNGGIVQNAGDFWMGYALSASNNNVLVDGAGSRLAAGGAVVVGLYAGANTLTIANGGEVSSADGIALGALSGSSGTLNIGRFGTNDAAGVLSVTAMGFGAGGGIINFNQRDAFTLSNSLSGNGAVNQLGTATTTLLGSNAAFTGVTTIENGTLRFGDGTSTGASPVGGNITNNSSLILMPASGERYTVQGFLSGSGTVSMLGSGTTVLSGGGSMSGSIKAEDGTLVISSALQVGSLGMGIADSHVTMTITNGGQVTTSQEVIVGYESYASSNTLAVLGSGSLAINGQNLILGAGGYANALVVSNGGTVSLGNMHLGFFSSGHSNANVVSGSQSSLLIANEMNIGYNGSGNSLSVTSEGSFNGSAVFIGRESGSSNNFIEVAGSNSFWSNSGNFYVGYNGSGNRLMISSNAEAVIGGDLAIGSGALSSSNTILVSGSGSVLSVTNGGSLYVGLGGNVNSLVISNGGSVNAASLSVGTASNSFLNNVTVGGGPESSRLNISGGVNVGYGGSGNSLTIATNGTAVIASASIGVETNASGNSVVINGGMLTNSGDMRIGYYGASNSLVISNGTASVGTNGTAVDVGLYASSSNNSVIVTGSNSLMRIGSTSRFALGYEGAGNAMVVTNGGRVTVTNSDAILGFTAGSSNNSLTIRGIGSVFSNNATLLVGNAGSGNSLNVLNGGLLSSSNARIGGTNASSFSNTLVVADTGSRWTNSGTIRVGSSGSYNSLLVTNGGIVQTAGDLFVGYDTTSSNNNILVEGAGSQLSSASGIAIGVQGGGTLTIANGGTVSSVDGIALGALSGSTGTLNIGRLGSNDAAGVLNVAAMGFGAGGGIINFNQRDAFTLANSLSGNGAVNQLGTGTTILSGNNSYGVTTLISAGALQSGSSNALGLGVVTLTNTGKLVVNSILSITSLNWASAGSTIALLGSGNYLDVTGAINLSGPTNTFDLTGFTLGNGPTRILAFNTNTLATNQFSVIGVSDYMLSISNNFLWVMGGLTARTNNTVIDNTSSYTSVTFQSNGILTITPSGDLTITASVNVTNNGMVALNGVLNTPNLTVSQGGALRGTGTLNGNLTNSGLLAPGNSPGSLTVNGNFTQTDTGKLLIEVAGKSVYDRLVVSGNSLLAGTLVITPYAGYTLQFGDKYTFLTSGGPIKGAFSSIEVPTGLRARLLIEGDPTASILIAPASYTQLAQGQNQINVAAALDSFISATSGDQLVVSTSLDSLTASQYAQAFNAMMPTFYQQIATVAFNQANAQNMELNQRLWGLRVAEGGGFSMSGLADNYAMLQEGIGDGSGKGVLDSKKDILRPGLDNRWGMFVDGNGIFAQANSANMLPGYNSESGGVTTGLTYKWNKNVASGIYAGYQGTYTKSGANGSGLGTGSSLIDNAVRFGVFGTYGQENGKGLYANALAGGAYHNLQATRVIQFTGLDRTANSSPGAGELDTMLATGYDLQKGNFTYGPTASLQYTYLGVNSVNETGAQSLNFNSGGWNSSSMLSSVGAHAAYNWRAGKDILVVPQISLNWQHEFMQNPYAINGTLGGTSPSFANWSATPIRDFLYTGVGVTVELGKRWNTSFFYNAAAGNSDLVSQNIFWSAGLKF